MIFPRALTDQLAALTMALDDPGTDLQAVLDVLLDDLAAAFPSFLGLSVTLRVDGCPVTLTVIDPILPFRACASLRLPLGALTGGDAGGTVVFYAGHPGTFVGLAAGIERVRGPAGLVVVDGDLAGTDRPPLRSGVVGLAELSVVNIAVGVLVTRGYTPAKANDGLRRRAADNRCGVADVARRVLESIDPSATLAAG